MPSQDSGFYTAAEAVVTGDVTTLSKLLSADPELSRARSPKHGATLLHFVAANGPVEDELQKTPANAVEVARLLLDSGSAVDAIIDGDRASTSLVGLVTSGFPAEAGLQGELVEVFLGAGAAVDGLDDDGYPLACALCFGYPDAIDALVAGGATVSGLVASAALGRLEAVESCFDEGGALSPDGARYADPFRRTFTASELLQVALEHARQGGHAEVVEFLSARIRE